MRYDIKLPAQPDAFKNFLEWTATTLCYRNMLVDQRYLNRIGLKLLAFHRLRSASRYIADDAEMITIYA